MAVARSLGWWALARTRAIHVTPPSTRITLVTSRTTGSFRRASTVALSAASSAWWVTTTSWASGPRSNCRTVWMETSCSANTAAIRASTPATSSTASDRW